MNAPEFTHFLTKLAFAAFLTAWLGSPALQVLDAAPAILEDGSGLRAEPEAGAVAKPVEDLAGLQLLLGEDVSSPKQRTTALDIIRLLTDDGKLDDLVAFLERMSQMAAVRNAIAWYSNELVVLGDDAKAAQNFDTALTLYQAVPPRNFILETQTLELERQRESLRLLEATAAAESRSPVSPAPTTTTDLIDDLKSDINTNEKALAQIQNNEYVDAAMVMRRGLCFYHLGRYEEALLCFRTLRLKFPAFKDNKKAAYGEIGIMQELNRSAGLLDLCKDFLKAHSDSAYAQDVTTIAATVRYHLSQLDASDKSVPPDKIIADLNGFFKDFPDDGPVLCLLADTYQKKSDTDNALAAYSKAVMTQGPDNMNQYALDSATAILQTNNDWNAIAKLHGEFLLKYPNSQLAPLAAAQVVKMKLREDKGEEAAQILADALATIIRNPANERVESLLDLMAQSLVPHNRPAKKQAESIAGQLDQQLAAILTNAIGAKPGPTATARLFYAQARLSQLLERMSRTDRSDLLLKVVALNFASDPAVLSPTLLSACGDILLQEGNLDAAAAMYQRLSDNYKNSPFADAGPLGLGKVALARKHPQEAIRIFDDSLVNNQGTSRFRETTLGKLQALIDLGKFEDARTLAQQIMDDKAFHGEMAGKAYLMFAGCYRVEAALAPDATDTVELRRKAYATYQRIYITYQNLPEICAEAYWQAYETTKELHEDSLAADNLRVLAKHPKLQATQRSKDAKKLMR